MYNVLFWRGTNLLRLVTNLGATGDSSSSADSISDSPFRVLTSIVSCISKTNILLGIDFGSPELLEMISTTSLATLSDIANSIFASMVDLTALPPTREPLD